MARKSANSRSAPSVPRRRTRQNTQTTAEITSFKQEVNDVKTQAHNLTRCRTPANAIVLSLPFELADHVFAEMSTEELLDLDLPGNGTWRRHRKWNLTKINRNATTDEFRIHPRLDGLVREVNYIFRHGRPRRGIPNWYLNNKVVDTQHSVYGGARRGIFDILTLVLSPVSGHVHAQRWIKSSLSVARMTFRQIMWAAVSSLRIARAAVLGNGITPPDFEFKGFQFACRTATGQIQRVQVGYDNAQEGVTPAMARTYPAPSDPPERSLRTRMLDLD